MNDRKAKKTLDEMEVSTPYGILLSNEEQSNYISWPCKSGKVHINGYFTADQLEAIAWWIKNHG